jgi:hypothetical protein
MRKPAPLIKLVTPSQPLPRPNGRPKKHAMPPMPQEVLEGMTDLERQHYEYFLRAYKGDYPNMTPSDEIALTMAALEYVNLLRTQAQQMATGEPVSASRQHPGVQLRQWLDSMAATRKQRKNDPAAEERAAWQEALSGLSH